MVSSVVWAFILLRSASIWDLEINQLLNRPSSQSRLIWLQRLEDFGVHASYLRHIAYNYQLTFTFYNAANITYHWHSWEINCNAACHKIQIHSMHQTWESAGRLSSLVRSGGTDPCTYLNTSTASLKSIRPLPSASEVDAGAEWCNQTSTTSKLVEQLHSSLTEATKEDVEEYRPVSRYHSPDDWGQVTSLETEPRKV